jgi:glycerophosphoryl diester phosphodiesterase
MKRLGIAPPIRAAECGPAHGGWQLEVRGAREEFLARQRRLPFVQAMQARFACLFLATSLGGGLTSPAVDIIAHRGASHDAPENTVASTKLAWKQGADGSECDVWLTRDGQIIVIHDANTKKTAGLDRMVVEQTLAELRELDAGRWKAAKWKGEKLPTLEELIATLPNPEIRNPKSEHPRRLVIEIKCGPEILPELERVLKASGRPPAQFVIISFNYDVVTQARPRFPDIPILWLHSYRKDKQTGEMPKLPDLIARAKAARSDGLNLNHEFPIDAAFVKQVHDASLKLYVWTVNDAVKARELVAAGVDGITTDRPEWLRSQLKRRR